VIIDESILIERISKGDEAAFAMLYKHYYRPLCIYAMRFFSDHEDAREAVQTVMIKVWDQRATITKINSVSSFLYRSIHNHAINELKHQQVVEKHSEGIKNELHSLANDDVDEAFEIQLTARLKDAISQLPEKKREIFELKYFQGMKHKEIGEMLGISFRTVETHIVKGLQKLREILGDEKNSLRGK
jgi:RNA polymerase sigma-70 factor, ECF subfamily